MPVTPGTAIAPTLITDIGGAPVGLEGTVTTGANYVPNNGLVIFRLWANGTGALVVTFTPQGTNEGVGWAAGKVVTVPLSSTRWTGPFAPAQYNDANGNLRFIITDATTIFSFACIGISRFPY